MKKLLALFAAVLFMGCNWGSNASCACGVECCESGSCDVADCNCTCK